MALAQITTDIEKLEKTYEGYNGVSLTNFDNTSEPQIAVGSVVEVGGSIFEVQSSDEPITGWSGISNDTAVYIYIDSLGAASFSSASPIWNTARQGWYNSNDRAVAGVYKVDASTYQDKYIFYNSTDPSKDKYSGAGKTILTDATVDSYDIDTSGVLLTSITSASATRQDFEIYKPCSCIGVMPGLGGFLIQVYYGGGYRTYLRSYDSTGLIEETYHAVSFAPGRYSLYIYPNVTQTVYLYALGVFGEADLDNISSYFAEV